MSAEQETPEAFEGRTRAVLDESLTRIDARVRSRLNLARHAALAEAAKPRASLWRGLPLLPLSGAAACALVIAFVLWNRGSDSVLPGGEGAQAAVEVLDLLADDEALPLMEEGDRYFYEWAAAQDVST